ncbi:MAG: DUF3467 domain-containing protein [Clostridium sp.]
MYGLCREYQKQECNLVLSWRSEHAKRLLRALEDNIAKYERAFGPIRISEESPMPPLSGIKGEA